MAIRVYKPTSPARRHMSVLTYEEITKKTPEKSLVENLKKHSGRNKQGKITVRHQGGGNKQKYRIIDFKRDKVVQLYNRNQELQMPIHQQSLRHIDRSLLYKNPLSKTC